MTILIASAIALSVTTMKIPNGVLQLPPGCSGPAELSVLVDSYMGYISCNENKTSILVEGSVMSPAVCPKDAVEFKSRHGAPMVICLRNRVDRTSKRQIQTMAVDIGFGSLRIDVKEPQHVLLLLQIASSLRWDRKQ